MFEVRNDVIISFVAVRSFALLFKPACGLFPDFFRVFFNVRLALQAFRSSEGLFWSDISFSL